MKTTTSIAETPSMWGTFDGLRDHLFNQFQETPFDAETGLSLPALEQEVEA